MQLFLEYAGEGVKLNKVLFFYDRVKTTVFVYML